MKSDKPKLQKRYMVIPYDSSKPIVYFGDKNYENYTMHRDNKRKANYIRRHDEREDWTDLTKAGTWSRYILWNQKTLEKSARYMSKLFGINIILNI